MIHRKLALAVFLTISVAWGLSGCGGGGGGGAGGGGGTGTGGGGGGTKSPTVSEGTGKPSTAPTDKATAPTDKTEAGAAEGWGTIKGQIVLDGTPPKPAVLVAKGDENAKDAAVCAAEGVFSEELVVNSGNNGLRWVVVYIGGKPKIHPDLKEPEGTAELSQKGCHFIPHVLAMRQGQKFVIASEDPIAHNTKGDPFRNPGFNPVVPPAVEKKSVLEGPDLVAENLPINISCSIHPWMKAYLAVYNHPYFAVTDENGEFTIEKVPAGEQKLNIWHEKGYGEGSKEGKPITVKAGETTDLGQIKYAPKS
jgi:Polysaccharide lyase family 4, domain II